MGGGGGCSGFVLFDHKITVWRWVDFILLFVHLMVQWGGAEEYGGCGL